MKFEEFKEQLFQQGKKKGFSDMEVYMDSGEEFQVKVFDGEVDSYTISEGRGLSFRGLYNGKIGYSYTEKLDQDSIEILLKEAAENAQIIESEDKEVIFSGSEEYRDLQTYSAELDRVTPEAKIDFTLSLEKKALELDERIKKTNYCLFASITGETRIANTHGLDLKFQDNSAYTYLSVLAQENEDVKTAGKFMGSRDFNEFNAGDLAREAVEEAISLFGAKPLASGNYPVVLRRDVMAQILAAFSSNFNADNVQKGFSLFAGKLGEEVARPEVNIIDDPFHKKGFASSPFDDEGVATRKKKVIEGGVLKTFLHNLKTAAKDGVSSTGNAFKPSFKSPVDIAPSNMYIEPGNTDFENLLGKLDRGILIINVQGLHSGANPVSGDFSLGAYGYLVENGEISRPVNQITIAGNFLELLKDVVEIGSDFEFHMPSGRGHFGSPSILVKNLSVAGE